MKKVLVMAAMAAFVFACNSAPKTEEPAAEVVTVEEVVATEEAPACCDKEKAEGCCAKDKEACKKEGKECKKDGKECKKDGKCADKK